MKLNSQSADCRTVLGEREKLVDAAISAFYRNGCRNTAAEEILRSAEVPRDVYVENFESMEDLILVALKTWDDKCCAWLFSEMAARGQSPRAQILGLFDALFEWFQMADYRGCLFINAAVEYAEQDDPVHRAAAAHKRRFASHVKGLLRQGGASDPSSVSDQLMIIMEGAIVTTHMYGTAEAGRVAHEMAEKILNDAIPQVA